MTTSTMMKHIPRNYPAYMGEALQALAHDDYDKALQKAYIARDIALYDMKEPIGSYYVKQPQTICQSVYMIKRLRRKAQLRMRGY